MLKTRKKLVFQIRSDGKYVIYVQNVTWKTYFLHVVYISIKGKHDILVWRDIALHKEETDETKGK